MSIPPRTRLYQARLQVLRARDRLRNVPAGASALAFLDKAITDLDALVSLADPDSPVAPALGEPR
jgi:hypothetical protein